MRSRQRGSARRRAPRSSSGPAAAGASPSARGRRPRVGTLYTPEGEPRPRSQRFLPRSPRCSRSRRPRPAESEALEAEALRRSDLVKTALLRAVSHDLRSPLTGIRTAVGRAPQPDAPARPTTTGASCSRRSRSTPSGSTGSSATCSTSRGSRPAAPRPSPSVWPLDDLVREARRRARRDASRVEVVPARRRSSTSTPTQIQRVLANLIENALQVLAGRTSRCACASRRRARRRSSASSTRGPGSRRTSSSASSSRSTAARGDVRARRRPRPRDRARLRRRERRPRLGRVAARARARRSRSRCPVATCRAELPA